MLLGMNPFMKKYTEKLIIFNPRYNFFIRKKLNSHKMAWLTFISCAHAVPQKPIGVAHAQESNSPPHPPTPQ